MYTKKAILKQFFKGSIVPFVGAVLMALLSTLADTLSPQIIQVTVDQVILGKPADELSEFWILFANYFGGFESIRHRLWVMALILLAVSLLRVIGNFFFTIWNTHGSETLAKTIRNTMYSKLQRLPFSWFVKNKTGDIIQRCTSDIEMIRNFISEQLSSIFRIVITLVLALFFMFRMNPTLTWISIAPMPFIIVYSFIFHRNMEKGFLECDEQEGVVSSLIQENLTGVRVVRAFGQEKREKDKFFKQNGHYCSLWEKLGVILARFWATSDFFTYGEVAMIVIVGAIFTVNQDVTAGTYIAFISYNAMLVWPVRMLGRILSEQSKATVSLKRLMEIMQAEEEQEKPGAKDLPLKGDLDFQHVSFSYDEIHPILKDLTFHVKEGMTVGILGATGSGKSTLVELLDRLYELPEDSGTISIGGVDIRNITHRSLRSQIGYVGQEPFLFSRTIEENIGITKKTPLKDEIRQAALDACLHHSILKFKDGYETMVGERGVTLSGGQKQRTAIARAFMQETPYLIFDDSLSAVDTETDALIRQSMAKRFGTCTTILISHRITTISHADLILVLDQGGIAEMGTHETLKDTGGIYSTIYRAQSLVDEEVESHEG